ncbi:MAG: hypothetical protein HY713_14620 [candidate division NC10 bacterium]|nr:hypothetical protein [candidate division NC10 bacterium]
MIPVRDIVVTARFLSRLPAFLRKPVSTTEARAIIRRRLARREADFLALLRRAVYAHPASPYRALLRLAGCEYGDLERLVVQDGVESALRMLYRDGVYLTVEEFKGRRSVIRNGVTIPVDPWQLQNPDSAAHLSAQSSGSRGPRTPVSLDLVWVADEAVNRGVTLAARGDRPPRLAYWDVPGGTLYPLLAYAKCGAPPLRWFSPVDPAAPDLHPRYRWSARAIRWASRIAGAPLPRAEHVPVSDPLPIARWMASVLETGGIPFLLTYSSPAVRLCQAALAAGLNLRGAELRLYGEPITPARLAVIRRAGAEALPLYVATEAGRIGDACLAPGASDEVHLFHDLHALIQPGADGSRPGLPPHALLLSSIRSRVPLVLLNVSMGDQAVVEERSCGCPLEDVGWTTHLHTIRSYEKLTAGGMTFLDTDLITVLEEMLPIRFGGAPTDYQLVEEETADGQPRVRLLVDPRVGPLDSRAVAEAFLTAISQGSGVERVMGLAWRDADLLRVERRTPLTTSSGKILHLHQVPREIS